MQPAHVAPAGHVQAEMGVDVSVPTGTLGAVVDAAKPLSEAAQSRDLTKDEELKVVDAAISLAANPPSAGYRAQINVGLGKGFEVGGRYAGGGFRLGGRYQILRQAEHSVDLTVGLGGSRSAYAFPISSILGIVKLDDFVRWTVDVPVLVGVSRDWFRVWGGGRFAYTTFDTSLSIDIPSVKRIDLATFDGHGFYGGLQAGGAIGYKKLFFAVELTATLLRGTATTAILGSSHDTSLSGVVVQPAVGLLGEF